MRNILTIVVVFLMFFSFTSMSFANQERKVTLLIHTSQIYEGNSVTLAQAPHIIRDGVTYVSIRSMANYLGYSVSYDPLTKEYVIRSNQGELRFIPDGQTYRVDGERHAFSHGRALIEDGSMMIPLRVVADHAGIKLVPKTAENKVELIWREGEASQSEPEPVFEANFVTDKTTYKMGEPVIYRDISKNGTSEIVRRTWHNNEWAFFEPGPQTIMLEVENKDGEISTATRTITITDEQLYTIEQINSRFTPLGSKFPIERDYVLSFPTVPYEVENKESPVFRSNSPERTVSEGVYYRDEAEGDVRFIIHKQNARPQPVQVYVVARNIGDQDATVTVNNVGVSGPRNYVSSAGRSAIADYLRSYASNIPEGEFTIRPGETRAVIPTISAQTLAPEQILTAYADLHSDENVRYEVIVLDEENTLLSTLPYLQRVSAAQDGIHIRGTFAEGDRHMRVNERIGDEKSRIAIGDGTTDPFITGVDKLTGSEEVNRGNFGVMYHLEFEEVAPNTAIVVNPRGGHYAGAFLVNNNLIYAPAAGILSGPTEAGVIYRTGNRAEEVTISFSPAAGSNLPINVVFIPYQ
ncbi:copper amine oxidase N-terminal domain-containing protein [Desertibacillus haloalkaliphilus]|uniref:copper amine oxidase N-terminal domain-containing protein n=1 Tax=Desertibacillus haloalkaliphilus TaxID=1328930 RepID=UPI001C2723CB|nr:copper amine oxidase N-terminal domain-containing protein [Desertibacillus haloalkaliphilus]MBU8905961.1 copper amine oxidase N-terminal domain-containing protein [Desertibacillus haloalkaliphilus]